MDQENTFNNMKSIWKYLRTILICLPDSTKVEKYLELLKHSKRIPLMAPPDAHQFYQKHYLESSIYLPFLEGCQEVLDIGSGGGFPGIPLALMNPGIHFYLLDKRIRCTNFLKDVCQELSISNVTIITSRAEDLGRMSFKVDAVIARAVSRIYDILSWSIPVLRKNGLVILGKKPEI
jgi:16S rRNA (guanine527-N7)-methyltransferase